MLVPNQRHPKGKRAYLGSEEEKEWQSECGTRTMDQLVTLHLRSGTRETNVDPLLAFSFSFSLEHQSIVCATYVQGRFSSILNLMSLEKKSHIHVQR